VPNDSTDALVPLGWDARVLALSQDIATPDTQPGRVVRVERSACVVALGGGEEVLATAHPLPAVGDWVAVTVSHDRGIVRDVVPRWSALVREDPGGGTQVLAANVDLVLITTPADRPSAARVERESVAVWDSGARPVVVVTKTDLDSASYVDELRNRLTALDVVATSAPTGRGVDEVATLLQPNRTAALLGPSGAGKSTLANALLGGDVLAIGEVRDGDHRGRHTTTSRQLLAVPTGGVLIDTPGIRSLGLAGSGEGIDQTFADIAELAAGCRFADCRHDREPDCAVLLAVEDGALNPERLASYRKLERELAFEQRRHDPLARAENERKWKAIHKEVRRHYRETGKK
jgi:ribosome biogenesis GTPase / thiamine phosphate phosphatase